VVVLLLLAPALLPCFVVRSVPERLLVFAFDLC
jgi:hypothetical protein